MSQRISLTALIAGAWLLTMVAGFVAGRRSAPQPDASAASPPTPPAAPPHRPAGARRRPVRQAPRTA